jgi:flagellar hook-associated protein 1
MSSYFSGLDVAVRALQAQQAALDVTGHNVANANTKGFSRQNVELATTDPMNVPGLIMGTSAGQQGTGVMVAAIERARDNFLDVQYRTQVGAKSNAQVTSDSLEEVEIVLNEPSDNGLSSLVGKFFSAWQELANNPNDSATRTALVQQAGALLTDGLNRSSRQLKDIQTNLNDRVKTDVSEINTIGSEVASLNKQIVVAESSGQRANDFRDRRDLLIDRLSELVQVNVTEQPSGSIDVALGGQNLVSGYSTDALTTTATGPGGVWQVKFSSNSALATLGSAEIGGLVNARDTNLPNYLGQLNTIASSLISAVNTLHAAGYGQDGVNGRNFFSGTDAGNIAVDPAIAADPSKVAAADATGQSANNGTALAIAQLRDTMSPTTEDAYSALVSGLGVDRQSARDLNDNQTLLVDMLDKRRQEVSGVSLDEESVNMLRYQRAYEAAARLITTTDEMLNKLINETGLVGR